MKDLPNVGTDSCPVYKRARSLKWPPRIVDVVRADDLAELRAALLK